MPLHKSGKYMPEGGSVAPATIELDANGNYNFKGKRLLNINNVLHQDQLNDNEVVTRKHLQESLSPVVLKDRVKDAFSDIINVQPNYVSFLRKRLVNIGEGRDLKDAVTKGQVNTLIDDMKKEMEKTTLEDISKRVDVEKTNQEIHLKAIEDKLQKVNASEQIHYNEKRHSTTESTRIRAHYKR